jgi:ABC-type multidrug transport system fused ATPase/permease subunit
MRNQAFWRFARRLLAHRGLLVGAIVFSFLSAGGLAAGLVSLGPMLEMILGGGNPGSQLTLPAIAEGWVARHDGWPGPVLDAVRASIPLLPTTPIGGVALVLGAIGVLTVFGATANFLHQWCSMTLVARAVAGIRLEVFHHALHLPLGPVVRRGPAEIVSRVTRDTTELGRGLEALTGKALAQATKGVAAFAAAVWFDWRITLLAIAVAPVLGVILRKFGKRIRRGSRGMLEAQEGLLRIANESLQGLRAIKTSTGERHALGRFASGNRAAMREELTVRSARALASPLIEALAVFVVLGLALLAAREILLGRLAFTDFVLVLGALAAAGGSFKPVTALVNDIQAADAPARRLEEILSIPREGRRERDLPGLPRHARSIRIEGVSFRHGDDLPWTLREIDLEIRHGETLAVVGPNGSGKTTLVSLLPRLLDPVEGRVLVDGIDLRAVSLRSLRSQIGAVTQEAVLLKETIAGNIRFGLLGASDAAVEDAARRAHADGFIRNLPQGYATVISEQGASLSGGQRQRLAIARAVLREPAILIMDEATSQVDAESEEQINAAIAEFGRGRTVVVVAHRLSTVRNADRIAVLDAGRLVGLGRHDELVETCETYRRLVRTQLVGG